tara:strand:- start:770 stop:1000 length:231 start_codon:yes stop_codon:yes gene_type:complete
MIDTSEPVYKTPLYQRKAYDAYIERNKDNEAFLEKRREQQRNYYKKNREKVLSRMKEKRIRDKEKSLYNDSSSQSE